MNNKIKLDILKLHNNLEDKKPNSWICVSGKGLYEILNQTINKITYTPDKKLTSKIIKDIRAKNKLSQENLAKKINVHPQTIHLYEKAIKRPSYQRLIKLNNLFKNKNLINVIKVYNNIKKQGIAKEISKKLNCSKSIILERLSGRKKKIPIPILKEILNLSKKYLSKREFNIFYKNLIESIEFLNVNTLGSKKIKAIQLLSTDLCKICGAHAADGSLSKRFTISSRNKSDIKEVIANIKKRYPKHPSKLNIHYNKRFKEYRIEINEDEFKYIINSKIKFSVSYAIRIVEGDLNAIKAYKEWIQNCFSIIPKIKKSNKYNMYEINIHSKVISRYLINLFDFKSGRKIETVKEPKIIKQSPFKFKKAFALGALTFDGSVELDKTTSFCSKSKDFMKFIYKILRKSLPPHIRIDVRWNFNKNQIIISKSIKNDDFKLLLGFFEKNTKKWNRLNEFANGFNKKINNYKEAITILTEYESNANNIRVKFNDIMNILNSNKKPFWCANSLLEEIKNIKNYNKLGLDSVYKRVYLLKKMGIIKSEKYRDFVGNNITGKKEAYIFNKDISSWNLPKI
ncbi:MAG: helix-turn-helix domain-containing protein [Nanoarchaeota archaeon]|nr:helix-turn-helix domain-containing protein [Nanoarchaeota archaeon]